MGMSPSPPGRKDCLSLSSLDQLERQLTTPRQIATKRMRCLGKTFIEEPFSTLQSRGNYGDIASGGLPALLLSLLEEAFQSWSFFTETITAASSSSRPNNATICNSNESEILQRTIRLILKVTQLDPTLGEEIGRAGTQPICTLLLKQISILGEENISEQDCDALVELQDSIFEMYSPSSAARSMAFEDDELRGRLPLVYNLNQASHCTEAIMPSGQMADDDHNAAIFINQVTKRQSAQADVGFVMWPSAIALSRWLASNPHVLEGKSVLELGAGCGLVGIAAARIITAQPQEQQQEQDHAANPELSEEQVIITDVNEFVLENIAQNILLNDVATSASVAKLDFYSQSGRDPGTWTAGEINGSKEMRRERVDVILAADIICQPSDAVAASKTILDALKPGGAAFVVCATAQHRYGVDIFADECEKRGLGIAAKNMAEMYDVGGGLSLKDMQTATGYVEGMELTFFEINKQQDASIPSMIENQCETDAREGYGDEDILQFFKRMS